MFTAISLYFRYGVFVTFVVSLFKVCHVPLPYISARMIVWRINGRLSGLFCAVICAIIVSKMNDVFINV